MTEDELKAIEERANAATPGPWGTYKSLNGWHYTVPHKDDHDYLLGKHPNGAENAAFIAHAREDIPALIAEIRRLQAGLDATGLPWVKWRHSEGPYREA